MRISTAVLHWIFWMAACAAADTTVIAGSGSPESGKTGKELVDIYCALCHATPKPRDLPKETWPVELALMGLYVGYPEKVEGLAISQFEASPMAAYPGMVPEKPLISPGEWQRLRRYLIDNAKPQAEMLIERPPLPVQTQFDVVTPKLDLPGDNLILSLHVDSDHNRLYVGSGKYDDLSAFDLKSGERTSYARFVGPPRDIIPLAGGRLRIGTMPFMEAVSRVVDFDEFGMMPTGRHIVMDDKCIVQTRIWMADFNGDGVDDMLSICYGVGWGPFGDGRARVFWGPIHDTEAKPAGKGAKESKSSGMRETRLLEYQGIVDALVDDFNKDGRPDVLMLIANGSQQLLLFVNRGEERFEMVMREDYFPAAGGMALASADFDGDGYPDIVMNRGNNQELEDYKAAKPYHGVYILRNNQNLTFTQQYFFPMYGSTRSVVDDFDGDGHTDIATVSLDPYPKAKQMLTFAYLKGEGNWRFSASTLPQKNWGRWVHITSGDVNGDGRPDIVLGDGSGWPWNTARDKRDFRRPLGKRKEFPPVLYLINKP